ncbi:MFS transporter [Falsirhodobacter xinxiangensis]|uniref:MFS transporter n=1 Tax=Falsirhodobacter xinxiangensis TaxID=2530049 RepID=UPI0010AA9232|nr:MFS transporter [Rhodobacter xinxiangensis]
MSRETAAIWTIGYVHGLSHLFMLLLPPLFVLMAADMDISIAQMGLAIAGFNLVTAVTQYPMGLAVDRFGGVLCLRIGLATSGAAIALMAVSSSFAGLAAAYLLCGLANAVYHPADFRILNDTVSKERRAFAFSVHALAGNLGFALAPALILPVALWSNWRIGLLLAAGLAVPGLVALARFRTSPRPAKEAQAGGVVITSMMWTQLGIFTLLSTVSAGVQSFSAIAAGLAFGYPAGAMTTALTVYFATGAMGIVAGGRLLRTLPDVRCFIGGCACAVLCWIAIWSGLWGVAGYTAALGLLGFAMGCVLPARDMVVARSAPRGRQGQSYGFVTTGINIGQFTAPIAIGAMIERGFTGGYFAFVLTALMLAICAGMLTQTRTYLTQAEIS